MGRLCERPGCSDPASAAYGMRPEDLVFWLDRLDGSSNPDVGVLCQRHADSMIVPRNWTLDDLRDPDLHLFRPPPSAATTRPRARRSTTASAGESEQLDLGVGAGVEPSEPGVDPTPVVEAWLPSFDDADDLGGLLAARSPLLARAFRGADRPR